MHRNRPFVLNVLGHVFPGTCLTRLVWVCCILSRILWMVSLGRSLSGEGGTLETTHGIFYLPSRLPLAASSLSRVAYELVAQHIASSLIPANAKIWPWSYIFISRHLDDRFSEWATDVPDSAGCLDCTCKMGCSILAGCMVHSPESFRADEGETSLVAGDTSYRRMVGRGPSVSLGSPTTIPSPVPRGTEALDS